MAGGENYPVLSRRKQAQLTSEAAKAQLARLRQEAAAEAEAECVMKYQERDRPYPISMKVLEKLCRHFPEDSQEKIFKRFWALARDDRDLLHSATSMGFNGYAADIYDKVMVRLTGRRRSTKKRRSQRNAKVAVRGT
jgi:hypothetical protein